MSNKLRSELNELDRLLRKAKPPTAMSGVQLTIEKVCGFELHNTRPYHNYETFSDGYRVSDGTITVAAEDLDDAVRLYVAKLGAAA